jgi:hypothetical protein
MLIKQMLMKKVGFKGGYIHLNIIGGNSDAPRAQRGASRSLNLIIYELCRFIPAYPS